MLSFAIVDTIFGRNEITSIIILLNSKKEMLEIIFIDRNSKV